MMFGRQKEIWLFFMYCPSPTHDAMVYSLHLFRHTLQPGADGRLEASVQPLLSKSLMPGLTQFEMTATATSTGEPSNKGF